MTSVPAPVECYPLSKSSFSANCAVDETAKAGLLANGVDLKDVGPVVRALLDAGKDAEKIAAALVAAGFIIAGGTVPQVASTVAAGLAKAGSSNWTDYSCCRYGYNGPFFPHSPTYGWDTSIPC